MIIEVAVLTVVVFVTGFLCVKARVLLQSLWFKLRHSSVREDRLDDLQERLWRLESKMIPKRRAKR